MVETIFSFLLKFAKKPMARKIFFYATNTEKELDIFLGWKHRVGYRGILIDPISDIIRLSLIMLSVLSLLCGSIFLTIIFVGTLFILNRLRKKSLIYIITEYFIKEKVSHHQDIVALAKKNGLKFNEKNAKFFTKILEALQNDGKISYQGDIIYSNFESILEGLDE